MELSQGLRRARLIRRDSQALVFGARSWTWDQMVDRIARQAAVMKALGMRPDDRVAILAHNSDRYVEAYYGPVWAGGIMVPLNTRLALPELAYIVDDCTPRILMVDDDFADQVDPLRARCPSIEHVVFIGEGPVPDGMIGYEDALAAHDPVPDAGRGGDDIATLMYTGGTTGKSKGVMLTHDNIYWNGLIALANGRITEDTRHLHAGPLYHLGSGSRVYSITMSAGTHVVIPRFSVDALIDAIPRHRLTSIVIVPAMATMMLNHPAMGGADVSTITQISYGAAPMPEAVIRRLAERFPTARLMQSFGMTEASPVLTNLQAEDHHPAKGLLASVGRPVPTCEIRIVDAEDNELPIGETGEICARGPMIMKGYWMKPELTAQALRGGWYHTGDAGYLNRDGYLFVVDRVKDMIVSGGENVYSTEVESAIHEHPDVAECAVIGVPDDQWGERVHAVVVPRSGALLDAAAIQVHCRALIAGYKVPKSVDIRDEPLPLSAANKILKAELRKPFWEGRDRAVS